MIDYSFYKLIIMILLYLSAIVVYIRATRIGGSLFYKLILIFFLFLGALGIIFKIISYVNEKKEMEKWEEFKIENNCVLKEVNNQGQDAWNCNGIIYYIKSISN